MGVDEEGTLAALKTCRRNIIDPKIASIAAASSRPRVTVLWLSLQAPSMRCAAPWKSSAGWPKAVPTCPKIDGSIRIGINVGDIIIDEGDIYGDGVNIAARIEAIAEAGGISISEDAWRQVQGKVEANFVDAGEHSLKNIARPVRVYRLDLGPKPASASESPRQTPAPPDKPSIAVLAFNNMSGDPEQEFFPTVSVRTSSPISRNCRNFASSRATQPSPIRTGRSM